MNYSEIAKKILNAVGGKNNVINLTHCATRLRFNLKDESIVNRKSLEEIPEVMGITVGGGQYQVIIGSEVRHIYNEISPQLSNIIENTKSNDIKKSLGSRFIETISSIFTPILPAITASGMIKAVLALLVAFKWVDNTEQTYQIINFIADAGFYFLPILLANSAAKKFKANPYLAMMVGGVLLHPTFITMVAASKESGEAIKLTMLPIYNANYASSVIPIILAIWLMSYIEKFADKYSPKMIKFFTVPLITILLTSIITLVILGPIGFIIGNGIASGITFLDERVSWLVPMVLGGLFPLLVLTGTHYGIIPIGANNIMTLGSDAMVGPGNLASNIAQGGAALAVGLKSKNQTIKELGISSGITAVCGITEPALFGINMRFKTPLYASMIGGAVGGLFIGIFKVRRFATGSPGLMTLPVYIGEDGFNNLLFACLGSLIAFIVAFIISYVLFKDDEKAEKEIIDLDNGSSFTSEDSSQNNLKDTLVKIYAPTSGKKIPLSDVNDGAFSSGAMGPGFAIIPSDGKFVSPIDGKVEMVFETKHAIGLKTNSGIEMLIHIGLDTVKLDGKPFNVLVNTGDIVNIGTPLVDVNLEEIAKQGFETTTPVVLTNLNKNSEIVNIQELNVDKGEIVMEVSNNV